MRTNEKNRNMTYVESVQDTHPIKAITKKHNAGRSWWQQKWASLFFTIALSAADLSVLYQITDSAVKQHVWMGWIFSIVLALCLNFIPVILAEAKHNYDDDFRKEDNKQVILIALALFALLYIATVIVRFAFYDIYIDTSSAAGGMTNAMNTATSGSDAVAITDSAKAKAIFFSFLTAISPLVTSGANYLISYMTNNPMKERLKEREERREELLMEINRIDVAIENLERNREEQLAFDEGRFEAAKQVIHYECETLKAQALYILAEEIAANSEAISKISSDAANKAEAGKLPDVRLPQLPEKAESEEEDSGSLPDHSDNSDNEETSKVKIPA